MIFEGFIKKLILKKIVKYINGDLREKVNIMLSGKKAYIVAVIGGVIAAGNIALKLLNGQAVSLEDIYALLGAFGIGALRAGIAKK